MHVGLCVSVCVQVWCMCVYVCVVGGDEGQGSWKRKGLRFGNKECETVMLDLPKSMAPLRCPIYDDLRRNQIVDCG